MKFKFNDRVKIIGDGFYSGQEGVVVCYDNFHAEIYTILLPYDVKASIDANLLEKIKSTTLKTHEYFIG